MTKITFIGGGSVQWTPGLVSDIALTATLHSSEIVLHDINVAALKTMVPLCKRISAYHQADLQITGTADRAKALKDADFVVLCVGIGGLAAMSNDLKIPEEYGVYQSVGDTVGPGGLARGLRHIPFAVDVAREMEALCSDAWLLNLTNPMTTICRGITKATRIRTIGLCHEVSGMQHHLASLFYVPAQDIVFEVAGLNHLPIITRCSIGGRDGLAMLREWLAEHDPFEFVEDRELESVFEVFVDTMAIKLTLFQQLGVLFGAGDRHIAEFVPGILTDPNDKGRRFGVHLTTPAHREEMLRRRKEDVQHFTPPNQRSDEQLAPLMAALLGGPTGEFVVNVPNVGQIDKLPRDATVECVVHADDLGVRPLAVGTLPSAGQAIVAGHVERQELIVEAALTGKFELANAALATDPLITNPQVVAPMFNDLIAAHEQSQQAGEAMLKALNIAQAETELEDVNVQPAPSVVERPSVPVSQRPKGIRGLLRRLLPKKGRAPDGPSGSYSVHHTTIGELLKNETTCAILEKYFPGLLDDPRVTMASGLTLASASRYAPRIVTQESLERIEAELQEL